MAHEQALMIVIPRRVRRAALHMLRRYGVKYRALTWATSLL
jgi:hypothetical protein